ncbi:MULTISPECIES: MbtH family protein [unclassified Streptomyces]|uniref:MbtH family protein n=1 Tax=unclassified Streptomyces TaxID=2593676 RepID=UPI00223863AD|nr:MbtH family NRPS accessory protein [Streptomyces sp. SHP 1-2]MCW5254083.1 MbtH family NRPS accessory protein [Streptomyces sp. SHP 1-2]
MTGTTTEDERDSWVIVVNDEEQYSVWAPGGEPPPGWHTVGFTGNRAECLDEIARIWTDPRPLSLRD